jgi:hypothetical protein
MRSHCPKLPFDAMPGLPSDDEEEMAELMGALNHLPRDGIDGLARRLLRAALARERSGEVAHLTRLAEDMLTTVRLQRYLTESDAEGGNLLTDYVKPNKLTLLLLTCRCTYRSSKHSSCSNRKLAVSNKPPGG